MRAGLRARWARTATATVVIGAAAVPGLARAAAHVAPALTVAGEKLEWRPVAGVSRYVVETVTSASRRHRITYGLVHGTSFSPRRRPGRTVRYRVRANVGRAPWTRMVAIRFAPRAQIAGSPVATAASSFTVGLSGVRIAWHAVPGATSYLAAVSTAPRGSPGRVTTYQSLGAVSSWTPSAQPGRTLYYGIGAATARAVRWSSSEVTVAWPTSSGSISATSSPVPGASTAPPSPPDIPTAAPTTPPPSAASPMLVGVNEVDGGEADAQDIASSFQIDRMEVGDGESATDFTHAGLKVDMLFSGPYTTGGVSALNAASWAQNAASIFQSQCGGSAQNCPAVEVLNEPWGWWFWGSNAQSPANEAAYAHLLVTTYNAFHARYGSSSPAILAGYGSASWWSGVAAAVPNLGDYYDGIYVHPYGGATDPTQSALGDRALVAGAHASTGKPVWVTEVGWPTAVGRPATGDSLQWTETQQADNIYGFVNWARSTGYVASVMLFQYQDYGTNMWYGIERQDGSKKPGWSALAEAAQQQPCTVCG